MADALRAAARAEGFTDAMHLQLFESNSDLKAEQLKRLGKFNQPGLIFGGAMPVLAVERGILALRACVDQWVLVVRAGRAKREVERTLGALSHRVLGVVLNAPGAGVSSS